MPDRVRYHIGGIQIFKEVIKEPPVCGQVNRLYATGVSACGPCTREKGHSGWHMHDGRGFVVSWPPAANRFGRSEDTR